MRRVHRFLLLLVFAMALGCWQGMFDVDLSDADVLALYAHPGMYQRLLPQLEKMKPEARILSYHFDIPGLEHDAMLQFSSRSFGSDKVYMWTIPLRKAPEAVEQSAAAAVEYGSVPVADPAAAPREGIANWFADNLALVGLLLAAVLAVTVLAWRRARA